MKKNLIHVAWILLAAGTAQLTLLPMTAAHAARASANLSNPSTSVANAKEKRKALKKIEAALNLIYPNREAFIRNIITEASIKLTRPKLAKKPSIFHWYSQPGAMKTSLIHDFHKMLAEAFNIYPDVGLNINEESLKPGTLLFPIEKIRQANGKGIVYLNEFQNLVPFAVIQERLAALRATDAKAKNTAHAAQIEELEKAIKQRLEAEDYLWELTATGRITRAAAESIGTHYTNLEAPMKGYIKALSNVRDADAKIAELEIQYSVKKDEADALRAKLDEKEDALTKLERAAREARAAAKDKNKGDKDAANSKGDTPAITAAEKAVSEQRKAYTTARDAVTAFANKRLEKARGERNSASQAVKDSLESLESAAKIVLSDRPDLFTMIPTTGGKPLTAEDIIDAFKANPKRLQTDVYLRARTLGEQSSTTTVDGRQLMIFFDGNIEDTVGTPAMKEFRKSSKTADEYRAIVGKYATQEVLSKFVLDRFSPREGWDSRLGLSIAQYILPDGTTALRKAARQRLHESMRDFDEEMKLEGISTKMVLDRSVDALIEETSSDATGQYRNLSVIWQEFFGQLMVEAPDAVTNIKRGPKPSKVKITYDRATRALKLVGIWPEGVTPSVKSPELISLEVRKPNLSQDQNDTPSEVSDRLDAYHQVGHLLLGTMMYGSVPIEVSRTLSNSGPGSSKLWQDPEGETLGYKRAQIYSVIGGILAQAELSLPAKTSAASEKDLEHSQELVAEYLQLLDQRESYFAEHQNVTERKHAGADLVLTKSLSDGDEKSVADFEALPYFQGIADLRVRRELAKIYTLTSRFLAENQTLTTRLVDELMDKTVISGDAIKQALRDNHSGLNPALLERIENEAPGTVVLERLHTPFSKGPSLENLLKAREGRDQSLLAREAAAEGRFPVDHDVPGAITPVVNHTTRGPVEHVVHHALQHLGSWFGL